MRWSLAAFRAAPRDKQGRITVPFQVDHTYIDDGTFLGKKGYLMLATPEPQVAMAEALKHPGLRDRLEVRLSPEVVAGLKRLGIRDVAAHFQGRTIRATGKPQEILYLCFPAIAVCTVVVERLEDIEVLDDAPSPSHKSTEATPGSPVKL